MLVMVVIMLVVVAAPGVSLSPPPPRLVEAILEEVTVHAEPLLSSSSSSSRRPALPLMNRVFPEYERRYAAYHDVRRKSAPPPVYDQYRGAVLVLRFDQPLFVAHTAPITDITSSNRALRGIVSLSCDGHIFAGRPWSNDSVEERVPSYLAPLYQASNPASLAALFNSAVVSSSSSSSGGGGGDGSGDDRSQLQASNEFRALLLLEYAEHGEEPVVLEAGDVLRGERHRESFYSPLEQQPQQQQQQQQQQQYQLTPTCTVMIDGNTSLTNYHHTPVSRAQVPLRPTATMKWHWHADNDSDYDDDNEEEKEATSSSSSPPPPPSSSSSLVLLVDTFTTTHPERMERLEVYDCNVMSAWRQWNGSMWENSFIETGSAQQQRMVHHDREQAFALMEVVAFTRTADELRASQVLELISDPIQHIVIPAVVQTALDAVKEPLLDIVMPLIEEIVTPPLIEPIRQAMIPTGAWIELDSSVRAGGGGGHRHRHHGRTDVTLPTNMTDDATMASLVERLQTAVLRKVRTNTRRMLVTRTNHTAMRAQVDAVRERFRQTRMAELKPLFDADKAAAAAAAPPSSPPKQRHHRRHRHQTPVRWDADDDANGIGRHDGASVDDVAFVELMSGEAPIEDEGKFSGTSMAEVPDYVTRGTALQVFDNIALTTGDNLRHGVNRTIVRQATREVSTSLTESLTFHLVDMITKRTHRSLTHLCTHAVTRPLIPLLSHSLATTISHAMTRKTQYDYYCYFCLVHPAKLYCPYCYESFDLEQHIDHYAIYYAAYYSKYYESFYGELYSDKVSKDYLFRNPLTPYGEGEQREAQGELAIDRFQFENEENQRERNPVQEKGDPKVYHFDSTIKEKDGVLQEEYQHGSNDVHVLWEPAPEDDGAPI